MSNSAHNEADAWDNAEAAHYEGQAMAEAKSAIATGND
jgi:hypothetical protein